MYIYISLSLYIYIYIHIGDLPPTRAGQGIGPGQVPRGRRRPPRLYVCIYNIYIYICINSIDIDIRIHIIITAAASPPRLRRLDLNYITRLQD